MNAIFAITKDTLREMSRRKLLLSIIIAGILMALLFVLVTVIAGIYLPEIFQKGGSAQAMGAGYGFIGTIFSIGVDILGVLLVLFSFSSFLPTEIDRGTIKLIISKPVNRMEVVTGKFLGGAIVMAGYTIMMGILQILASLYLTKTFDIQELYVYILLFSKFLMLGSAVMALSVIVRPILAAVIAFFLSGDIFSLLAMLFSSKIIKIPLMAFYYILPTYYTALYEIPRKLSSEALSFTEILYKTAYGLDFMIIALAITVILFNKKDLI